jgi:hypothetical protein
MAKILRREDVFDGRRNVSRAVIECTCGEEVLCMFNTNSCGGCGGEYNISGQHLASRSQWGAETGEHPTDVVNGMDAEGDW